MARKKTNDSTQTDAGADAAESEPSWQARAVERSLERPRAAAQERSASFVATALKMVERRGGADFTVQDLVTAMKISTRTFYQYFRSKEELLVAMFEEVQREHNRELRSAAQAESDPIERLEAFVLGILHRAEGPQRSAVGRLLIQQFLQLQASHPEELRASYAGLLDYLADLIADAAAADELTSTDHRRTAALLMQMIVSSTQASVIGSPVIDPPPTPQEVWHFCRSGIGAAPKSALESAPESAPKAQRSAAARKRPAKVAAAQR